MAFENIAKSLFVANQLPLDAKTYFVTTTEMQNLGASNYKAYQYYEYMKVLCVETGTYFVWKEVGALGTGILEDNFQYPENTITENIDYSNRYFNFVAEGIGESSTTAIGIGFVILKNPNNDPNNRYLEINDIGLGFFAPDKFGTRIYIGGSVNNDTSWKKIDEINPENI